MKLNQLFETFLDPGQHPFSQIEISGVYSEARKVQLGGVFVALRGLKHDGHDFISQAIQQGCMAVVVEDKSKVPTDFTGYVLQVPDSRAALDVLATRFFSNPSRELFCFGITGTNGKTSITYLLEHILSFVGLPNGVIGTVNHRVGEKVWSSEMTTPDPLLLQQRLREFCEAGARAVSMEVSSHALDQKRVDSVAFNCMIFTNLTRDHLDYHGSMQKYFEAKQRLFLDLIRQTTKYPVYAVINTADAWGRKMKVADPAVLWTYGAKDSDFRHKILKMDFSGAEFSLNSVFGEQIIKIPQAGEHNVLNSIAAMLGALSAGIRLEVSAQALAQFKGVPGRLQRVLTHEWPAKENFHVFIDYAHTPDALENVLKTMRELLQKTNKEQGRRAQLITLFGCGGDRDKGKRPLMASLAEAYSDRVIVTSDNPRTEDAQMIIDEIAAGFKKIKPHFFLDRREAIRQGVQGMNEHDVLLIAGKGHEDYQILGTEKIHFSDYEESYQALQQIK